MTNPDQPSAPLRDQLQRSLGESYTLDRELGGGGMSRVFIAEERALGRRVVVKVLAPDLAQGLSFDRFAREIKLAAALQDPHIVPVLSAGASDGLPWYTMPFVQGESLRTRLRRGRVPLTEAVGILRDVALALEYAHAQGVVHRDIKPENILLSGRTAVVADFGIAKAVSAARTSAEGTRPAGTLTSVGTSLGTPAYMAPEQAVGDPTDHRADIYAWGIVAYEMLAGTHPFANRATQQQLIAAQIAETPQPLDERSPGLPPPLAALVMQCVEKSPANRPSSAADLVAALDGTVTPASISGPTAGSRSKVGTSVNKRGLGAVAVGVVAVVAAGVWTLGRPKSTAEPAPDARAHTIAVLPFEHRGDTADAYFTEGMADEIRGKLMAVPGLSVIARGSSVPYRGTSKLPKEIANELGARYLLSGTVQLMGTGATRRVIVRPELVEVTQDGAPQGRWQQPFEAEMRDVVRVQGDIAGRVAEAMQVALGGTTQQRLTEAPTRDAAAYDLYLRGQAAWNYGASTDPRSLGSARSFFEQAVARDSTMLASWAQLSRVASIEYNNATPSVGLARTAEMAAQRALRLVPDSPEGLLAIGTYDRVVKRDFPGALEPLQRARRLAPSDAQIATELAINLGDLGRFDESLRELDAAAQVDPRAGRPWVYRARLLLRMRRIEEARAAAERALALAPTATNAMSVRTLVELAAGDLAAARRVVAAAKRDLPPERVISYVATYWDLGWMLDGDDERLLYSLTPSAFADSGNAAIVFAEQHHWRGDAAAARRFGEIAVPILEAQEREAPTDAQRSINRGLALAYAGRSSEAMSAARKGLAMEGGHPGGLTAITYAYFLYAAARTAMIAGDRDQALTWLRESLERRYFATPAWVRLDASWAPLRGDPRFEKMLAEAK